MQNIDQYSSEDLIDVLEQDHGSIDVFVSTEGQGFDQIYQYIDDAPQYSIIRLEEEDLISQLSILQGLYQVVFEELPDADKNVLDLIDALEDEIGEINQCLLVVEGFDECGDDAQASLLELIIVSKTFKLLVNVGQAFDVQSNQRLWDVLATRAAVLVDQSVSSPIGSGAGLEPDFEQEEAVVDPDVNGNKPKVWYQLIPKYHLAVAALLILFVIALWQMDIGQRKEESLDLNATFEQKAIEQDEVQSVAGSDAPSQTDEDLGTESLTEEEMLSTSEITELVLVDGTAQVIKPEESKPQSTPKPVSKPKSVSKPKPGPNSKEAPQVTVKQGFDWRPYQSAAWIKGLDSKYYTLQLMASHNDQGIRDFLTGYGVNSQYAVYTTTKDGKPWHVVIYGVYETHQFASEARERLPDYLTSYSPWIRSFKSIQDSL